MAFDIKGAFTERADSRLDGSTLGKGASVVQRATQPKEKERGSRKRLGRERAGYIVLSIGSAVAFDKVHRPRKKMMKAMIMCSGRTSGSS